MPRFPELVIALPDWVEPALPRPQASFRTHEERMRLAISLARDNVSRGTGGPFGAAIFDLDTGRLIAPGVNLVVSARWSGGHAEMVACAIAQRILGSHDLGAGHTPRCELVTSSEPCAMCLGALPWSGIRSLVCGARREDAEAIGFDEGATSVGWVTALEARGIAVARDVERDAATAVLQAYAAAGGPIYNGCGSAPGSDA